MAVRATAAQGQSLFDRSQNVTVQARPRPEYDPPGLPVGPGFTLFPRLIVGETYDDNIVDLPPADLLDVLAQALPSPQLYTQYTDKLRPLGDFQTSLEPSVSLKSNWNQNSLQITADAILTRSASYATVSGSYPTANHTDFQNSDQYGVAAAGTLNVRHDLTVNLEASFGRRLLPRTFDGYVIVVSLPTALAVATSIAPLYANETAAKAEVVKDFARFRLTGRFEFQNFEYPNGFGPAFVFSDIGPMSQPDPTKSFLTVGPVGQGYHDHASYTEFVRGDYAISPDVAVFVEDTVTESEYPNIFLRNRLDEETLVGLSFQIPSIVTAEIGVGNLYSHVSYAGLHASDTPDFRARITYFATPLIDITLTASEFIVDSGVPQAPNYLDKTFGVAANYELLRNLILTAQADLNFEDYRAIDRHVRTNDEGIGATYLMNRAMRVSLAYVRRRYASSGAQPVARAFHEFEDNRVSLAFTLQH